MSVNLKKALMVGSGVVFGAALVLGFTKVERPREKKLSIAKIQGLKKMSRAAEVEIINLDQVLPQSSDQPVTLRGHIRLENPMDSEVTYQWILPDGVEIVEGSIAGSLGTMAAGQTLDVDIRVTGLSVDAEPRTVVLQARAHKNGIKMGGVASFSSHPVDQEARKVASQKLQNQSDDLEEASVEKRKMFKGISQ